MQVSWMTKNVAVKIFFSKRLFNLFVLNVACSVGFSTAEYMVLEIKTGDSGSLQGAKINRQFSGGYSVL